MRYKITKNLILLLIMIVFLTSNCLCNPIYEDKLGRDIIDIVAPTKEQLIDPDTMNYAIRFVPSGDKDYSESNYTGPTKNIFSSNIILPEDFYDDEINEYKNSIANNEVKDLYKLNEGLTKIRHTQSITNVDEDRYIIGSDSKTNRITMKIIVNSIGSIDAKNGIILMKMD